MVLTTFSFLQFLYNFQIFIKNQESYWLPHFSLFFTTPKSPKFTTTKFSCFVKPTFSLERGCKNQFLHSHAAWEAFFLWSAPSVGARFLHFATPPQREGDFFHFFDPSPARIKKINKFALRSYGFDASARKSPKANRQQIVILLRQVRSGRVFLIAKKLTNRFKNVCNTQGISIITT